MSQRKSRKSPKRSIRSTPSTTFAGRQMRVAPTEKRDHLTALHRQGNFEQVRDCARKIVEEYPEDAFTWTALGSSLLKLKSYEEALLALDTANALFPDDYLILDALAKAHTWLGNHRQAIAEQRRCLELEPEYAPGHFHMAALLNESGSPEALEHLDKAESLGYDLAEVLSLRGSVQTALLQFNAALATFRKLLEIRPDDPSTQNNIANVYKDIGQFRKAEEAYRRALELDPAFVMAYSNQFFSMHYDPERTPESILEFAREWEKRFAPPYRLKSPKEANPSPNKRLRVGLLSSGLRQHPVGQMITAGLENLDDSIELYAYSTDNIHDHITERIRNAVASWQPIGHLGEPQLAEKIRQDGIDILIDLSGHGAGNRLRTVSMRPAPIAVKWVGGLVNTMGLESFDYLLSDPIETPSGVDHLYVEKLIRMPDDYICYLPPDYLPPITALPAIVNGYITLGCFNNPAKMNPVLLSEWAILMQQIPYSRLLLKGAQYDSLEFREHIREILFGHGIEAERLILEGPSSHKDLLETYNRIDIALDPWPYSGGLTTCEAMLMGVPVVTFPGPTFAGRHSATHLVNAGMPELVTNSWEEYRQRVIELASDWPNLSVIRACLRRVLLQSPVCDGPRFARHFTAAMRAIWQRHCEGKAPAALTLDKEGQAWFEGDSQPVRLQHPPVDVASKVGFDFALQGKIITLDNGGLLVGDPKFAELQKLDTFATIAFDPASKVRNVQQLQQQGELHHYPQVVLGDGQEATLFACLDPAMSATLAPLPAEHQLPGNEQATQVIAKLPIATLRLDDIEGLESIDWLLLDNMNDSLKILENGAKTLSNILLVQARINFIPTHQHQPELTQISHWLSRHGFSFYRLNNLQHYSHLPKRDDLIKQQATQLSSADALFIPNASRIAKLTDNQRLKLVFVLHTVYGIQDLSYALLEQINPETALAYLSTNGLIEIKPDIKDQSKDTDSPKKQSHEHKYKNQAPALLTTRETRQKILVGVPVYNEEKYIEKTIESLKNQSMDGVGFLISDNQSSDRTFEIIQDTVGNDDRFEIFQQSTNLGSFENFKFVFKNTKSEYFLWLGAHDYLSTDYLESTAKALDKDQSASMACGMPYAVFNDKVTGPTKGAVYEFSEDSPVERYIKSVARLANCTVFHSLFRREALNDFDFRKVISCDHVIISHLLWYGKLTYVSDARYYRRYFEKRQESYEERLAGKDHEIPRSDFYKLYEDDFTALAKDTLGTKELITQTRKIQEILKKRFN